MQTRSIMLGIAAVGLLYSGVARAEDFNEFESLTDSQGTSFTIVFEGDVVSSINVTAMETDATVNPFYRVIVTLHGGGWNLDGDGVSQRPRQYCRHFHRAIPNRIGSVEFVSRPSPFRARSLRLERRRTQADRGFPILVERIDQDSVALGGRWTRRRSARARSSTKSSSRTSRRGHRPSGNGSRFPIPAPRRRRFSPKIFTDGDVTLSNVGFQLSQTLIPLDNLNFGDYPPPGSSGSNFTPLPQYDGPMSGVPEPSTWAMMLIGFASLGFLGYRASRVSSDWA